MAYSAQLRRSLATLFAFAALALFVVAASDRLNGAAAPGDVSGVVVEEHGDDPISRRSVRYLTLLAADGERFTLDGPGAARLRPGQAVKLRAPAKRGSTLTVNAPTQIDTLSGREAAVAATGDEQELAATGLADGESSAASVVSKRVAVLLINFVPPSPNPTPSPSPCVTPSASPSASPSATPVPSACPSPTPTPSPSPSPTPPPQPWTHAQVRATYFDGTKSVAKYYAEVSNDTWQMTGDVFGWYTLAVSTTSCDYNNWAKAARAVATAAGVDLTGYTNISYAFPAQSVCKWGGLGNINGPHSWLNGWATNSYVVAHELGHNFGTHHASSLSCTSNGVRVQISSNCTADEYGDPFDLMASASTGTRHINTWARRIIGILSSADQQTVTTSGTYAIAVAQKAGGTPRILRVARNSSDFYYLEARQPYGLFDNWSASSAAVNGVMIRIAPNSSRVQSKLIDANPSTTTFADAPLAVGQRFVDAANEVTIITRSIGPSGATVYIQVGPDVTPPSAPSSLSASLASPTSVSLKWAGSFDEIGVTGYRILRDGVLIASVSGTSYTDTSVAQGGSRTYQVIARDAAGNLSPATSRSIVVPDTIAPSVPGALAIATANGVATLSWAAATDNVGVTAYRVVRDGVLIATVSDTGYTDASVTPGVSYSYAVSARDAAGNIGSATVKSIVMPDTLAPSAPGAIGIDARTETSIALSWAPATDNVGVTGYRVLRNGTPVATVSGTSHTDSGLAAWTSYEYAVVAFDAANNTGPAVTRVARTADTTAPGTPGAPSATATGAHSVSLSWSAATDNVGVTGYRVLRNGTLLATVTGSSHTDSSAPDGVALEYVVVALDAAGNASGPATTTITLADVTAPSAPGSISVTMAAGSSVRVAWTAASDNVAVSAYRVLRGTTTLATVAASAREYTDGPLADGPYSYAVVALDAAGNVGPSRSGSISVHTVDTTPPSVPTGLAARSLDERYIKLTWNASSDDRAGTIRYRVFRDGAAISALISTTSYTDRPASTGSYYYQVRAVDVAGNRSARSSLVAGKAVRDALGVHTVDVTPPSVPTGLAARSLDARYIKLTWNASSDDRPGTIRYRLFRDGSAIGTLITTTTYTDRPPSTGSYYYQVRAVDVAGNRSARSSLVAGKAVRDALDESTVDVTPPSVPTGLAARSLDERYIKLTWNASSDDRAGTIRYRVFRDGAAISALISTTSYTDRPASTGSYYYQVRAVDVAGNRSARSSLVAGVARK